MHRIVLFSLLMIQICLAAISEARVVGEITGYSGAIKIEREGATLTEIKKGLELHVGDKITTGEKSWIGGTIGKGIAGLESDRYYRFILRADSQIEIRDLLLLMMLKGDIEIKIRGLDLTFETDYTSIARLGTEFRMVSREAGTLVSVSKGQVELTRKDEQRGKPARILRDYEAVISRLLFDMDLSFQSDLDNGSISDDLAKEFEERGLPLSQDAVISTDELGHRWSITDERNEQIYLVVNRNGGLKVYDDRLEDRPLEVVSYRSTWAQAGLLIMPPGVSRLYAKRDAKRAITSVVSTGVLLGILYNNGRREKALKMSIRTYNDYRNEIKPAETQQLYDQYQRERRNAKVFRNREIGLSVLFGCLFVYEAVQTILDARAYSEMTEEFLKSRKEILSGVQVSFERGEGATLGVKLARAF